LTNIIDELLLLSSVRKEDVQPKPLDMADIVVEARERLTDMLSEHQAEVSEAAEWPAALGHAPWVEEIWVNYISNAVKYGGRPEQGVPPHVELGFDAPTNAHVRFWVRDNGPGLAPEEQARLFAPFTRLHQMRAKGHGLGLSIVQRIAERLDGEVGVESETGKGSVFYFTLPTIT
jgi:signal transduction histidine kinase